MDLLARAGDAVRRFWSSLDAGRRAALGVAAVVALLLIGWGSRAAAGSWQRVAGPELDEAARADVAKSLKQSGQRHEVRDGGVWVPKEDAERVVLELAGQGVLSDRAIWQWLDTTDVFAGPWQQDARYRVALQRKLESMIRKIDAVRNASVLITPASESHGFAFRGSTAKASVQVELKAGAKLTDANVRAIAGTVSGAVKGLEREAVVIVDQKGIPYQVPRTEGAAIGAGDLQAIEAATEERIKAKILGLFRNALVEVKAFAKYTSERRSEKKYDPRGIPEHERERRVTPSPLPPPTTGIKGGGDLQAPVAPSPAAPPQERELETKWKVGETQIDQQNPAGSIERVTVGILLPYPVDRDGKAIGETPNLEQVRELAMQAGGIRNRGDVSVMLVPTKAPEAAAPPAASERAFEWISDNAAAIGLIVLGLAALLVVVRLVRGAAGREEVVEIPARPALAAGAGEGDVLRDTVREFVRRDPAEAASSLRSWMR
jgi:flagellar biosynthesis/type III secretory pathway M-ring protein FliF/YscJ